MTRATLPGGTGAAEHAVAYPARVAALLVARWQGTAAFVVLLVTVEATRAWSAEYAGGRLSAGALSGWFLVEMLTVGTGAVLGPVLAEAAGWRGWRGILLTIAATFAAVAAGAGTVRIFAGGLLAQQVSNGAIVSAESFLLSVMWIFAMAGLLFAAYARMRDREIATARAAQAAELERAGAQRLVMESRLKVLQARIEPEFLFGTLEEVQAHYRRAPATAEHMLDELIRYLRAALPRMRGEESTIGGELELVRAYLAVLQAPLRNGLRVDIDGDPHLYRQRFPPMVLLPLVQGAVAGGAGERQRIGIAVVADGEAVRIEITVEGGGRPATWRDDPSSGIGEALAVTHGAGCTVGFVTAGELHRAVIVVLPPAATGPRPAPPR